MGEPFARAKPARAQNRHAREESQILLSAALHEIHTAWATNQHVRNTYCLCGIISLGHACIHSSTDASHNHKVNPDLVEMHSGSQIGGCGRSLPTLARTCNSGLTEAATLQRVGRLPVSCKFLSQGPSLRKYGIGMRMASARSCSWQPSMTFTLLGQRTNLCGTHIAYVSSAALQDLACTRQLMHPSCAGVTSHLSGAVAMRPGTQVKGMCTGLEPACFLRGSCTRARHAQTRNSSADASYTHGGHITSHEHEVDIFSWGTSGELRRSRIRHNL